MGRSFLPADLSARFEQWLFNRRIPRSQETVRMLLGQIRQPISVYGAGSHTLQLMQWGLKVNRVFDRLGSSVSGFPLPVQPLNQWRPKDGPLLLSHAEHEWTMRDHLASCGIPCIPLYTREDFETPMEPVDAPAKGDKPRVVVLTAQSRALLNSEHFSALAPEFEIIPLHAGTRFQTNPGLPILGSHLLAYAWVEQLQPDLLILQDHFSDGHFWPLWAQLFFPNVPTVLALYDVLR
ncbi:MAG: hypothetical protein KDC71_20170, partial [Acidobacteria bacterium]|nr:hypothetical protein [Acidobacteriota bacterium]